MDNNKTALGQIFEKLWAKRLKFILIWVVTFALSCLIIIPQPRYYDCTVKLAPESGESGMGGIAALASFVNLDIGGMTGGDAIYPMLYPDVFSSPEFIVDLMKIQVSTYDGQLETDYYTYLNRHQKSNIITKPFYKAKSSIKKALTPKDANAKKNSASVYEIDPFNLSKRESQIAEIITNKIKCDVDRKTDVISITIRDQDRKVCALLADSVSSHLQNFITDYRTMKSRQDLAYYKTLADSAKAEYDRAIVVYSHYQDSHRKSSLQQTQDFGEQLRNDLETKLTIYNTFNAQYQAAKAKVQEKTPAFTTLKSATIPQKPAGPKRKMFIIVMLFLATVATAAWFVREDISAFFKAGNSDDDKKPLFKIIEG